MLAPVADGDSGWQESPSQAVLFADEIAAVRAVLGGALSEARVVAALSRCGGNAERAINALLDDSTGDAAAEVGPAPNRDKPESIDGEVVAGSQESDGSSAAKETSEPADSSAKNPDRFVPGAPVAAAATGGAGITLVPRQKKRPREEAETIDLTTTHPVPYLNPRPIRALPPQSALPAPSPVDIEMYEQRPRPPSPPVRAAAPAPVTDMRMAVAPPDAEFGDFPVECDWMLVGKSNVPGLSTNRGRRLDAGEVVHFAFPSSEKIHGGLKMTARKAAALAQIVRFSTKRAGEIGKLSAEWAQCLVPLVNSSKVKIQGKLAFPTMELSLMQEILLDVSFYIHKSVLAEVNSSPCDMLDHKNAASPLHKLLNLLNLKPSNKDASSLDDLTTRKLKQILRGNNNSGDDSTPVLGQTFLEQGADEQAISEAALNKLVGTAETFDLEDFSLDDLTTRKLKQIPRVNNNNGDDSTSMLGQTFLEQDADEQSISEAALNKLVGSAETFDLEEQAASAPPPERETRQRRGGRSSRTQPTTQTPVEEALAPELRDAGGSSSSSGDEATLGDEATSGDEATVEGSTFSVASTVYLRGPAKLPRRPMPIEARPLIRPYGDRNWKLVESGAKARKVNGILGGLCRLHYPGLVEVSDARLEPATHFDHYELAADAMDRSGNKYKNKAERVVRELWDFYRCEEGKEERAARVAVASCKKRVTDMIHDARLQAHIWHYAKFKKLRLKKDEARQVVLTREEYLAAIPNWCNRHPDAWERIVDKWLTEDWKKVHDEYRERSLMMQGVPHHQGSRNLSEFAESWSASHGGLPCGQLKAYALSHLGKASSDTDWHPDVPASSFTNASIHPRISAYIEMARSVHGEQYNPTNEERLDPELVMRVGQGKKHGRFCLGDGVLDTTSTPRLNQIRAASTSSSPAIRQRPTVVSTLQAKMQAMEADREVERQRMAAIEAKAQHDAQQLAQVLTYVRGLVMTQGGEIPPFLLPQPQPTPPPQHDSTPSFSPVVPY